MSAPEDTGKKQRGAPAWKPGQSGNPSGRPLGARNKLGEDFLKALHEDFDAHGMEAIVKCREDDPVQYIKVIAGILPKELNVKIDPLDEMTDAELIERIEQLQAAIVGVLPGAGEAGEAQGGRGLRKVRPH